MLRRLLSYAEEKLALGVLLAGLHDRRQRPRIALLVVVRSVVVMFLARLGSLNGLVQTRPSAFWRRYLLAPLPSDDSLSRIAAAMEPDDVRRVHGELYRQLQAHKALPPLVAGLRPLILDGHESHSSYRRHCPACCQRVVKTVQGERVQFYHRYVAALLATGALPLWLDAEPLRPGEDEIAAALRLLERLLDRYPRAFDLVLGDALYTDPRVYSFLLGRGKDVLTVLKGDHPGLLANALGLFAQQAPQTLPDGSLAWDASGFTSWPQVKATVRVLRTAETRVVRRQATGEREVLRSQWMWVTTLSPHRASTAAAARLGHARWQIENQGFNEVVTRWHLDHVYHHQPVALLVFLLLGLLAVNVFFAFYSRNLKPEVRQHQSCQHVARRLAAEIYVSLDLPPSRPP